MDNNSKKNKSISIEEADKQAGTAWLGGFLFGGAIVGAIGLAVASDLKETVRSQQDRLENERRETERLRRRIEEAELAKSSQLRSKDRETERLRRKIEEAETLGSSLLRSKNRRITRLEKENNVLRKDATPATRAKATISGTDYLEEFDTFMDTAFGL